MRKRNAKKVEIARRNNFDGTTGLFGGGRVWGARITGGVGGVSISLGLLVPLINTWMADTKEIALAQIKNSIEQIAYMTHRVAESDKERDLYKKEMLECQARLRGEARR